MPLSEMSFQTGMNMLGIKSSYAVNRNTNSNCFFIFLFFTIFPSILFSQKRQDSIIEIGNNYITLSNVIIDHNLNVPSFINKVKSDTSFYKAFKNLRILGYTAINDIRMLDRNQKLQASLHSKTKQQIIAHCRTMQTLEEAVTGDFYEEYKSYNYYTAQLYASLFFTKDSVCNETNIVGNEQFSTIDKSGIEKHKEQLKMLFFNPGKRIGGIPFMSGKTAIFDNDVAENYDMSIDADIYNHTNCIVFKQKVKQGKESNVVVDEMTTWFDDSTYDVMARNYTLSFDAGFYDFKVTMEVKMTKYKTLIVPELIRYNGNWKAIFKKRERGVFTATLFDFE